MSQATAAFSRADFLDKELHTDFAIKPKDLLLGIGGVCVSGTLVWYALDAFAMATGFFSLPVLLGVGYAVFAVLVFEFALEHVVLAFRR